MGYCCKNRGLRSISDFRMAYWPLRCRGSARAEVIGIALEEGIEVARQQTLVDFVFLMFYSLAISLSCTLIAPSLHDKAGAIGMMIAWGVLLASPFDAIEYLSLLRQLAGEVESPWPQLSTICAAVKFILTAGGLGFIGLGIALLLKQL